jgi:hypothetical protein
VVADLSPGDLQAIVTLVLAQDLDELRKVRDEAQQMMEAAPEGAWMKGLLETSIRSMDALIEYREALEVLSLDLQVSMGIDLPGKED